MDSKMRTQKFVSKATIATNTKEESVQETVKCMNSVLKICILFVDLYT